ncbi:F0F1 ATP synthase subunit delta [Jannaschia seohaensis]|uniref:ATP synthase subunit b n=1 Tax=Jannaschia seohaensis TaxID=475081 RepID=A0A2Y9C9A8_9RHOB|nr:F0F1 ATP synthase subunit delta [Jannaschia seohaensis]PWJ09789.1 F-type H+-transporting ATPase subunit b [Jannaschia seohaensis]SSA51943.1 F-type H+-transporting ATPase subunit b [Jannaschia seohaensis]
MQLDWLTVSAQIVNFLVLVWLLQRFLYRPITNAMRRREERVEARLSEAKATRAQAEDAARQLAQEQAGLEERQDEILEAAREEAKALRQRLEDEVRDEMEARREVWRQNLAEERAELVASLQRQAGHQVLRVVERVLADYAGTDLAGRVVEHFTERLEALDKETRDKLAEAARTQDRTALVQTSTVIESAARARLTRAIHETLSTDIEVDYHEDPRMIFGVRLTIGDHFLEWSAVRYLDRLEAEFGEIIETASLARGRGGQGERATT